EPPEELLCPVPDEQPSDHHAKDEQAEVHATTYPRSPTPLTRLHTFTGTGLSRRGDSDACASHRVPAGRPSDRTLLQAGGTPPRIRSSRRARTAAGGRIRGTGSTVRPGRSRNRAGGGAPVPDRS